MTEQQEQQGVQYDVLISEFASELPWPDVVARLRETLPNLASYIESKYAEGEPFALPRQFSLQHGLRLVEMLGRLGLKAELTPRQNQDHTDQATTEFSRKSTLEILGRALRLQIENPDWGTGWSLFLGLLFRLLAVLLAVPGMVWLVPTLADQSVAMILISAVGLLVTDLLWLAIGVLLLLSGTKVPLLTIEAMAAPVYLLEAIPIAGSVIGFFWRFAIRVQALVVLGPVEPARAALAVLAPWAIILVGTSVLAFMFLSIFS